MGRFTEKELREVYGDDKGWKAIVNQTDPDVEEFAGRGQRASSSRTGGGALVRADAETEDQQKKAKATTETREGAKAKTTAPAQTAKGKRKQRDEDEDDEEKEAEEEGEGEEEEKPKAKGKEAKKSEESSKRALSSVRDLRAKSKVLRYLSCSRRLSCDGPVDEPSPTITLLLLFCYLLFFRLQGASQEARPLAWPPRQEADHRCAGAGVRRARQLWRRSRS